MYVHNINPTIVNLGPLEIRWYGLVYVIGFILVYYYLNKRKDEFHLDKKEIENFVFYLIIGVVLGARLFEAFIWEPAYYLSSPIRLLEVWKGGMSLHGGLVGAMIVGWWFCKKHKIKLAKLADVVVIPAVFALALGRIANFINGELVGTVTAVKWCVVFPSYDELCRHPVQIYGAIGRMFLFGHLVLLNKVKKWKQGFLFWNFVLFMGIGRFFIDYLREDIRYFGLSTGQYLSIFMVLVGGFVLIKYYRREL